MWKRINIYFKERFPFWMYLILVSILFLSLSFIAQILSNQTPVIDYYSIGGILSGFLMMLLIRTFDDIKDKELDDEIFPDRPVSRGAVLLSDVNMLALISFVLLVLINSIVLPKTVFVFAVMIIYALLTFKWFFTKDLHLKKPKLAMITHQPLPFAIIFYLLQVALATGNIYDEMTNLHFALFFVYALPITAWEVSRKIKAAENENKHETFSKIFGLVPAVLIPIILYTITVGLSFRIAHLIGLHILFSILLFIYWLYLIYNFIRFLKNPIPKKNNLQKTAMLFTGLLFSTLIIFLLANYSVKINF